MIFRSRRPLAARNWVHEPISSPRESEMYEPPIGPGVSRPGMIGISEEATEATQTRFPVERCTQKWEQRII